MTINVYQIIQLVLAVIVAGLYIYKRITGKDVLRSIMLSRPVVKAVGAAVEAVYHIWPEKQALKVVYTIMNAAIDATEIAEKAWQMGNIAKEERNTFAKKLVQETLVKAGIEITPQVEMIVAGVIEAVCIVLPHTDKDEEDDSPATPIPVVRGDLMKE